MDNEPSKSSMVGKLLHRQFDSELDEILSFYMKEGTILGNLARLSRQINKKVVSEFSNDEFCEWQFGGDYND